MAMESTENLSGPLEGDAQHSEETVQREALRQAQSEIDAVASRLDTLEIEIARERRHPWKQVLSNLTFVALTRLSRFSPPLPARTAARFARSAQKKNPNRSLDGRDPSLLQDGPSTAGRGWTEFAGRRAVDPAKRNILIVSHDSSLTGAPILALNLLEHLSERYNVAVLVLRYGNMIDAFKTSATNVVLTDGMSTAAYGKLIRTMCQGKDLAFAVVNSIESHGVLQHLKNEGVEIVTLSHEFASYIRSNVRRRSAIEEIFAMSSEVVFSTRLTLDAARAKTPGVDMTRAHILPQGKCRVPAPVVQDANSAAEKDWLRAALRPHGKDDGRIVVIGAGTVNLRKGVDLFIQMATGVLKSANANNIFFYWIGPKYTPNEPNDYSSYLSDQIQRSGVGAHLKMLRETTDIELAYELADIFVLSSRLDPLPNVTIDAMSVGLPVVCFDNTSGIADLLADAGLKNECVADYLDTCDLADKVLALALDPALRGKVGAQSREFAAKAFDFDTYSRKIEALGLKASSARKTS